MKTKPLILCLFIAALMPSYAQDCNDSNFQINLSPGDRFWVPAVSGATYLWSPTGSLQIISGQGTNRVHVQGTGTLYVTRDHAGYHCYTSRYIDVGSGSGTIDPNCVPTFHVMDPNWNTYGETCPDTALELGVINECPAAVDYEWSIMGATVTGSTPDNRYIYIRTSANVNHNLTFRVRAVYSNGTTSAWFTEYGTTINCGSGGIGQIQ